MVVFHNLVICFFAVATYPLAGCACPSNEATSAASSALSEGAAGARSDECGPGKADGADASVVSSEPVGVRGPASEPRDSVDLHEGVDEPGALVHREYPSDAGVVPEPTGLPDAGHRPSPLQVEADFVAGCPYDLRVDSSDPDTQMIEDFVLEDPVGTNQTLHAACALRHSIRLERGYRLAAGEVRVFGEVALTRHGLASLSLSVGVPGQDAPDVDFVPFAEQDYVGTATLSARWPAIEACARAVEVNVETLMTATLRAERANTDPRRIAVSSVRFPELTPVECAPAR